MFTNRFIIAIFIMASFFVSGAAYAQTTPQSLPGTVNTSFSNAAPPSGCFGLKSVENEDVNYQVVSPKKESVKTLSTNQYVTRAIQGGQECVVLYNGVQYHIQQRRTYFAYQGALYVR